MRSIMMAAAALALTACVERVEERPLTGEQLVARGEYLVLGIGGCNDCHTPMTPQGPDMAYTLQGATLIFGPLQPMPFAPIAPPLAGGPAGYTDEQFASFLQTGVRPNGSHTLPPMPQFRLNEADAHAVVAYIKTLPQAGSAPEPATP